MELETIVCRVTPTNPRLKPKPELKSEGVGFNSNFFVNGNEESLSLPVSSDHKKRGRPPKTKRLESGAEFIAVEDDEDGNSESIMNVQYKKTYDDTTRMLNGTIMQIDSLNSQVQADLTAVRSSRQLKKKYDYISLLAGTATGLLNNKITAIREINNTITSCHNLEMKRVKEFKMNEQVDDDKKIMDMYNAWLNVPVGSVPPMSFSGTTPMQINGPVGMVGVDVDNTIQPMRGDSGYQQWEQNMSQEQRAMVMESNPHIKAVVVYNQETQDKWFDVIDTTTGQSIPGVPRPAEFLLTQMRVDVRTGVARNSQANMEYPVILMGNRAIDEY